MQGLIYFVIVFAMSLGADVYVHNSYEDFNKVLTDQMPAPKPVSYFTFGYHRSDQLLMRIHVINKPSNVKSIKALLYESDIKTEYISMTEDCYWIRRDLNYTEFKISFELYKSDSLCSLVIVAEGKEALTSRDEISQETYTYNDICLKAAACVLQVDFKQICEGSPIDTLKNIHPKTTNPITNFKETKVSSLPHENMKTSTNSSANITESTDRQPFPRNVLIYVITSIIVTCVILLVIYKSVKKYCHRNSQPVETMELNTYATANEVVYAELSLMHGDSQPQRHEEESPYAKIIGVLRPADEKRKINKS